MPQPKPKGFRATQIKAYLAKFPDAALADIAAHCESSSTNIGIVLNRLQGKGEVESWKDGNKNRWKLIEPAGDAGDVDPGDAALDAEIETLAELPAQAPTTKEGPRGRPGALPHLGGEVVTPSNPCSPIPRVDTVRDRFDPMFDSFGVPKDIDGQELTLQERTTWLHGYLAGLRESR